MPSENERLLDNKALFRNGVFKHIRDQTMMDSFCIDYFPEIKKRRFIENDSLENQLNKLIEVVGFDQVYNAFSHYLEKQQQIPSANLARKTLHRRFAFLSIAVVIGVTASFLWRELNEARALSVESALRSSCTKGNQPSCLKLVKHYSLRCDMSVWSSCVELADYYWIRKDWVRAYKYYNLACTEKETLGCYYKAILQLQGQGTTLDLEQAERTFKRLCDSHGDRACVRLGEIEWRRKIREPNAKFASLYSLFLDVCKHGESDGCVSAGIIAASGASDVPKDVSEASRLFLRACDELSDLTGCLREGLLFYDELIKDHERTQALHYFEKACSSRSGELDACVNMGLLYQNGVNGTTDSERAKSEFQYACRQGHQGGCLNLALLTIDTPETSSSDRSKAIEVIRHLCRMTDDANYCYNYAYVIRKNSSDEAVQLVNNGCKKKHQQSCLLLTSLSRQSPEQKRIAFSTLQELCVQKNPLAIACQLLSNIAAPATSLAR